MTNSTKPTTQTARFAGRLFIVVLVMAVVWPAGAQQRQERVARQPKEKKKVQQPTGGVIPESAPIANLFKRVEEGTDREDWKYVVDSLQRIVNDPQDALIETEEGVYQSARHRAEEVLCSLPGPALEAYRLLQDGRAKNLFDHAQATHDRSQMRKVLNRFFATSYGDQAAYHLALWLTDEGQPSRAVSVLSRILHEYPQSDIPRWRLLARLALAQAASGQTLAALETIEELKDTLGADHMPGESPTETVSLDRLRSYVNDRQDRTAPKRAPVDWPGIMGPQSNGLMPSVTPSLAIVMPWKVELTPGSMIRWPQDVVPFLDDRRRLPVPHAIADGQTLYVKSDRQVVAIELESFEEVWTAQDSVQGVLERRYRGSLRDPSRGGSARERALAAALSDYVGGSVSYAHGMVFTIDRQGDGITSDADGIAIVNRRQSGRGTSDFQLANRLAALDPTNGAVLWRRGRTFDTDDPLGRVEFLSPPVGVGPYLLCCGRSNRDLHAYILDPRGGALVKSVLLCTISDEDVETLPAQYPVVAEGTAYIPTGQGLLFALNVDDHSLEWASTYMNVDAEIKSGRIRSHAQAAGWLSTPPVIAGPLVLLAPTDGARLYGFDRTNGELVFQTVQHPFARYMISADARSAWVGGQELCKIDLSTGETVWQLDTPQSTGRCAHSGDVIYVPTGEGLLAVDAVSGTTLPEGIHAEQGPPLGNLLCFQGALYSVEVNQVRKFPDLEQAYPKTLAAHRVDPSRAGLAIRLAWLETIRNRPTAVLDALSRVKLSGSIDDQRRAENISHLRVKALIALSQSDTAAPRAALDYLERAVGETVRPEDKLIARIALSDQLARMENFKRAYQTLWDLALSPVARGMMSEEPSLKRRSLGVIAERMATVAGRLMPDERAALRAGIEESLRTAAAALHGESDDDPTGAIDRLQLIAEINPPGELGARAWLVLGRYWREQLRLEQAEFCLPQALRAAEGQTVAAEALVELAWLYLGVDLQMYAATDRCLDVLNRLYADTRLPTEGGALVRDVVRELAAQIPSGELAKEKLSIRPGRFALTDTVVWPTEDVEPDHVEEIIHFPHERPGALTDNVLTFEWPNVVRARSVSDGKLLWMAQLVRLNPFTDKYAEAQSDSRGDHAEMRSAWGDGQILAISTADMLHGIGMVTGKHLWMRELEIGAEPYPAGSIRHFHASDGVVAFLSAPGVLEVCRGIDLQTQWVRHLPDRRAELVRIVDDYLLVSDGPGRTVGIYDLHDGREISNLTFRQPAGARMDVIVCGDTVVGPDQDSVVGLGMRDTALRWQHSFDGSPVSLFELPQARVGVGLEGGRFAIIEGVGGEILLQGDTEKRQGIIKTGTIHNGMCILAGICNPNSQHLGLFGYDLAGGELAWKHDRTSRASIMPYYLSLCDSLLPVTYSSPPSSKRKANARGDSRIVLLDKVTGQQAGTPFERPPSRAFGWTGDLAVYPERLLIGTKRGIVAIEVTPDAPTSRGQLD